MRRIGRIAPLALLLCLLSAAPAAACGSAVHARAKAKKPRGHRGALVIGDSTMIFAAPKLARLGLTTDARGCRQFGEGLAIVRARRRSGSLAHLVVLALGANGPVPRGGIRQALRAIGPRRVLGLVTPRNNGSAAATMRAAARATPSRVVLVDWAAHSAGNGSWFAGDGLHVNHTGAWAYARLIAGRTEGAISPPVRRLRGMRSGRAQRDCGTIRRFGRRLQVQIVRASASVSCSQARGVARRPPLGLRSRWRWYDWRPTRRGPWRDVYVRGRRRPMVIATRAPVRPAPTPPEPTPSPEPTPEASPAP